MPAKARKLRSVVLGLVLLVAGAGHALATDELRGTIVVAVPVSNGLVVCADKRLYNARSRTFTDKTVKIRKIDDQSLFVATSTVGFYDSRSRTMAFDAFDVAERYTSSKRLSEGRPFWDGLKREIEVSLRKYFAARPFTEWPETDRASNNLLFNLIVYSVSDDRAFSHTLRVYYEKSKTPIITIPDPIREEIRSTKLAGKGREVMNFIARTPRVSSDPMMLRFGGSEFDRKNTSSTDAVGFARKLIRLTSSGVPSANVSPTSDCAMLDHRSGFSWLD